jgi:hypothetical protein
MDRSVPVADKRFGFGVEEVPDDEVDRAIGKEELVRRIIQFLACIHRFRIDKKI